MSADHARKVQRLRVLSGRLTRMIEDGSFYDLPYLKRHGLIRRVKRLYGSLVGPVSPALLRTVLAGAATIVIGACVPAGGDDAPKADNPSFAAPVNDALGLSQLLNGAYGLYGVTAPAFADIDEDGDADLFAGGGGGGESSGEVWYFENQGTRMAASFAAPAARPDLPSLYQTPLIPVLAPIDGDGDWDVFVGQRRFTLPALTFYENTGTAAVAAFLPATMPGSGSLIEVGGVDSRQLSVTFVDIDGDGDLDAFVSHTTYSAGYQNSIKYYENTGTAAVAAFVDQGTLPNLAVPPGFYAFPTFVDIDADGDFDAFIGDSAGHIQFFRNTGTPTSPSFAAAEQNPFGISDVPYGPAVPAFMDIDADGDFDLFVGDGAGNIWFSENTNL